MPGADDFDPRAFHAQHELAIIVACSENGVIGLEGDLPWRLPIDLRHFMRSTLGCPVIMGRKTFESLDTPLPNRLNIVVSGIMPRSEDSEVMVVRGLEEAIEAGRASGLGSPIWIAGGGTIYEQVMDQADLVVRTLVHTRVQGDTRFPALDEEHWRLAHAEHHRQDERHAWPFSIEWWVCRPEG